MNKTQVQIKQNGRCNSNLRFTIHPFQDAVDYFYRRQMEQLGLDAERVRVGKLLVENGVASKRPL